MSGDFDFMKNNIKHIVHVMFENRSFDNVLGWLYETDQPENLINIKNPAGFDGLKADTYYNQRKANSKKVYATKVPDNKKFVPTFDPYEEYEHITNQIFGNKKNPPEGTAATMAGFLEDYATLYDSPEQIMQCYSPVDLPVLNGLAREYAVSDRYFCSIPSQTNGNRAFAACGNSLGVLNNSDELRAWVNNRNFSFRPPHITQPQGRQFNQKTLWNVLSENNMDDSNDWMIYYSRGFEVENELGIEDYSYTRSLMEKLQDEKFDKHFDRIDAFYERAKNGTLPSVSFLEPAWGISEWRNIAGVQGSDYHPPTNVEPGEKFLLGLYAALRSNPDSFKETLLIINFDEHGGTYDHTPPPWGDFAPWGGDSATPTPDSYEGDFKFNRLGVRVPLILVSPYIPPKTLFRARGDIPFDHASVIATILNFCGVDKTKWGLGNRVERAPTFESALSLMSPRESQPEFRANDNLGAGEENAPEKKKFNDIQHLLVHRALQSEIKKKNHNELEARQIFKKYFDNNDGTTKSLVDALESTINDLNKK